MMPRAKKQFGQNFLVDGSVVRKIVEAAGIVPGEAVLEIGPGTGVLTEALVAAGAKVTAVEADHDLVAPLTEKFGDKIDLIEGDVLSLSDSLTLRLSDYKLVANIPYNITSDILNRFLTAAHPPSRMVLMVQREVADRIAAVPPDMSLLSVVCQLYADVSKVTNVPRGAFRPSPNVDSAVVRLDPKPSEHAENVIRLAKVGFSSRRKQLHGNLAGPGVASSASAKAALVALGLPETARAENLSVHNWIELRRLLY
ncbi:ribosomal RNA small subunit methyltransferase A [bacterium]|nr:ribosomal RNA small subunit methyltransferase A [bacterium]